MQNPPRYWYGPKRFLGRRLAITWEGWLTDGIWIATWIGISPLLRPESKYPIQGLGLMFGSLVIFLAIRSWKGDPERWED
jgi:hypothetical protein